MTVVAIVAVLLALPPDRADATVAGPAGDLSLRDWEGFAGQRLAVEARLTWASLAAAHIVHGVETDGAEVTLWLPKDGPDRTGQTVLVEATVRVVRHPAQGSRAAFTEVRLLDPILLR
jgi:hypothetical protein